MRAELGEQGWQSSDLPLDSDGVAVLVEDLSGLRADTIVADALGPTELEGFGLAPPRARIQVDPAQDGDARQALPLALLIGDRDPKRGQFVQREGDSKIYALDPSSGPSLPDSWESFVADYGRSDPPADSEDTDPGAAP